MKSQTLRKLMAWKYLYEILDMAKKYPRVKERTAIHELSIQFQSQGKMVEGKELQENIID